MISIGKDKLVLDTSNLSETDNVGAYLRDSLGNLLTSTLLGGKQALDVNIANDTFQIDVGTADQTAFTYGTSVEQTVGGVFQDAGATLTAGQQGAVRLTAQRAMHHNLRDSSGNELLGQKAMAASVPVAIASDQSAIPVVGNVADNSADSGNPVKVGSISSFGAVLTASGATGDRANMVSDRYRRVYMSHASNVGALNSTASIGTSAAQLISSSLNGRMNLLIQNLGTKAIFVGSSNAVTTANGVRIAAGSDMTVEVGENVSLWAISSAASQDVRLLEIG